jgi:glycosyltransferase involved in cell wall biosynthesis
MRLVRLPTIRSKHMDTVIHTMLSTAHAVFGDSDIVHYHALGPALFSFIPRMLGKKTLVTVQGLDWQRKKWGRIAAAVLRAGEQGAIRLPSATMVVSETLQKYYRDRYGVETLYVPNGTSLRERRGDAKLAGWKLEREKYILFLGRFSPEKNCHLLIEAYEQLDTTVKLVLAGGSSYSDGYVAGLQAHASERVKLLDWVAGQELEELLSNAMLFVLPSDLEGLSLALLDAMGAGVCVLTSDIPENRELVEGAGFTFRHGEAANLARMLRLLIADPETRHAAARAARARIRERYLWSKIAKEIERHYYDLLGRAHEAGEVAQTVATRVPGVPAETPVKDHVA